MVGALYLLGLLSTFGSLILLGRLLQKGFARFVWVARVLGLRFFILGLLLSFVGSLLLLGLLVPDGYC